jgi:hypothetical protein
MLGAGGIVFTLLAALAPGTPVRLQVADVGPMNGRLVSADASALVIDIGDLGPTRVPRDSIVRFQAVQGRRQTVKGLVIGAAWFAVLGLGVSHCPPEPELPPCRSVGEIAAIFAGVGAASGAAVGTLFTRQDWQTIPSSRIELSVAPRRQGAALTLAFRF